MSSPSTVALSGGIGGAKLALGLYRVLPPAALSVIVNTADDFDHLGLHICPDIDTVLYTLAGLSNPELGWGRGTETWTFLSVLEKLGGETWFRLGDGDLALHVYRTQRLAAGASLSDVTADAARQFGITATIVPMSEASIQTRVLTEEGELAFQEYFVRRRCQPRVRALRFEGAENSEPATAAVRALEPGAAGAIVICPSNPYLSVDPILAVSDMRRLLRAARAPIVAVTPLIGGAAVKGPTTKIMNELGVVPSPLAVAQHYQGLIDGFVLDARDRHLESNFDVPVHVTDTLMLTLSDRERLAREVLEFAASDRVRLRAASR
ncbi:MAG: 2-phospho-L-lactate transferase [Steroidobacteraceae bacterium]